MCEAIWIPTVDGGRGIVWSHIGTIDDSDLSIGGSESRVDRPGSSTRWRCCIGDDIDCISSRADCDARPADSCDDLICPDRVGSCVSEDASPERTIREDSASDRLCRRGRGCEDIERYSSICIETEDRVVSECDREATGSCLDDISGFECVTCVRCTVGSCGMIDIGCTALLTHGSIICEYRRTSSTDCFSIRIYTHPSLSYSADSIFQVPSCCDS